MRARQRMSLGFDLGLIWAWKANVAGEQLLREHMSRKHLSWNHSIYNAIYNTRKYLDNNRSTPIRCSEKSFFSLRTVTVMTEHHEFHLIFVFLSSYRASSFFYFVGL